MKRPCTVAVGRRKIQNIPEREIVADSIHYSQWQVATMFSVPPPSNETSSSYWNLLAIIIPCTWWSTAQRFSFQYSLQHCSTLLEQFHDHDRELCLSWDHLRILLYFELSNNNFLNSINNINLFHSVFNIILQEYIIRTEMSWEVSAVRYQDLA